MEPPFLFENFPGVEAAARVFTKETVQVQSVNSKRGVARLIGIETDQFGNVAWMKDGLLPYHFYEYLNLMSVDPYGVLISRSLAEQLEVSPGDEMGVWWGGTEQLTVTVYAVIDYFPGFNPNPERKGTAAEAADNEQVTKPALIVGHLETVQNELALEPYDVWFRIKSSEARDVFYRTLEEKKIQIEKLHDTYEAVLDSRNDPFRMAMNGVMSLGFIMALCITILGFLLFWILSLQGRTLQLGTFRAMGMSFRELVGMLSAEQLLTSGVGFAFGIASGAAASIVFVPLFQLSFDLGKIVPPFHVVLKANDTFRLVFIVSIMMCVALSVLAWLLKQIKIHQAIKLGED